MAEHEAKGSIVLEILIVILTAALVAVILIPGKIWKEEALEEKTAHDNIMSIYEAEKYYKNLTGKFTTDPAKLIETIHSDSNLIRKQKVVNYTRELIREFDKYMNNPLIKNIVRIKKNVDQINDDLESNQYNFKSYKEINDEANELKIQLNNFMNAPEYPEFVRLVSYLDSLMDIRQTLTDFTLQVNALRIKNVTDSIQTYLPKVNIESVNNKWAPLSQRLDNFIKMVKRSPLVHVTSVADRVRDFKKLIDGSFDQLIKLDMNVQIQQLQQLNQGLDELYQKFLQDYSITSQFALSKLPESDSLIIHLTEQNFYSPVNHKMYQLMFDADSQFIKVESPVLLDDLKERAMKVVDDVNQLPFLDTMHDYLKMLDSIKTTADQIRKKYRKNTDLFIAYKEMEGLVNRYNNISIVEAYRDLEDFRTIVPKCRSFSTIKDLIEKSWKGIQIFDQAYTENVFGNLDTLHLKMDNKIDEIDKIIEKINKRRRRAKIKTLEPEKKALDSLLTTLKSQKDDAMLAKMKDMVKELQDIFIFAQKGKKVRVYGVFDKKIKNFGYIYKDSKSWEDKK
ncbi:hypothetical protein DRI50_01165 [candidate division KSB1 bacterium]|nr:MAG: hypothetical protein DRI50_01165 [candidate division KSB1 bacterium]